MGVMTVMHGGYLQQHLANQKILIAEQRQMSTTLSARLTNQTAPPTSASSGRQASNRPEDRDEVSQITFKDYRAQENVIEKLSN